MRFRLAALVLAAASCLAACGPSATELEPDLKEMLRGLAKAVVVNDKEKISFYVLNRAGQAGSPMAAQQENTPEGRAILAEGNRRSMRKIFKDAGILAETDIPNFLAAQKLYINGKNAKVVFEIAGEGRRAPEVVTFSCTHTEKGWLMDDYSREMKLR
jgi:hypothetical protein